MIDKTGQFGRLGDVAYRLSNGDNCCIYPAFRQIILR